MWSETPQVSLLRCDAYLVFAGHVVCMVDVAGNV